MPEREGSPGPDFLKDKYNLHTSEEAASAARRSEARGESVPEHDAGARIANYLDRFQEILEREDPAKRDRGLDALKHVLHDQFVIKPVEIPPSYWEFQQRIAREQGHGEVEITRQMKRELTEVIITDQESSLDNWVDYLSSDDATYPLWLKYFAMRGVLALGDYDKEKHQFRKRSKGTTKPFPDLNREALAYVLDAIEKQYSGSYLDLEDLDEHDQAKLQQLLEGANFGKLYAFAIEQVTPASAEDLSHVQGEWVKYDKSTDHMPLVKSLQGHGTGWCTAGESTAKTQLQHGDFYVYYSHDAKGQSTVPRAAIRMQGNKIAEVRGIAKEQNLDPAVADTVSQKLGEFGPEGAKYQEKAADMSRLTAVEKKVKANEPLDRADLVFLYELDKPIQGFGYQKDPRVAELRSQRNPTEDAPTVFGCTPEQIAHTPDTITVDTKAYVGPLEASIFQKISEQNLEHVYTEFPEGKIQRYEVQAKELGKTGTEYQAELKQKDIYVDYANDLLQHPDFERARQKKATDIQLVRLRVKDLDTQKEYPTTKDIFGSENDQDEAGNPAPFTKGRMTALGLELCSPDVGPALRLQQTDPVYASIAMQPILGRGGYPRVFGLSLHDGRLSLGAGSAEPGSEWGPDDRLVFRLRK